MDMRKIVIGLLVTLSVISFITAAATIDTNGRVTRLENRIDHLDEEVDETTTNVKKLLSRGSASSGMVKKAEVPPTTVSADVREYDFGKIRKENGKVSTTFVLANTGGDPLVVGDIVTSCGCTTAAITENSIAPGKSATLTATFNPNFHEEPQGRLFRSIFVPTNDPANQEIEFKIYFEIIN